MKIVINVRFGGFGLSKRAYEELGMQWDGYGYKYDGKDKRSDPDLVRIVEKLGDEANGAHAKLVVVEIPDDVQDWRIDEYDGWEHIAEGRIWQ